MSTALAQGRDIKQENLRDQEQVGSQQKGNLTSSLSHRTEAKYSGLPGNHIMTETVPLMGPSEI